MPSYIVIHTLHTHTAFIHCIHTHLLTRTCLCSICGGSVVSSGPAQRARHIASTTRDVKFSISSPITFPPETGLCLATVAERVSDGVSAQAHVHRRDDYDSHAAPQQLPPPDNTVSPIHPRNHRKITPVPEITPEITPEFTPEITSETAAWRRPGIELHERLGLCTQAASVKPGEQATAHDQCCNSSDGGTE
jgi:hypothetical protein